MRILIAPNAFKNSLTAEAAAHAIRAGLRESRLDCACECFPIGDGGDGTAALLTKRLGGKTAAANVRDPLGRRIRATFGLIQKNKTAVIELADASGLKLLRRGELDPLRASTRGTGELIRRALDEGASKIILGVGGSATTDGGTGILQALGVRFLDAQRNVLTDLPGQLRKLDAIDLSGLDRRWPRCELIVLCDVENPLLGRHGAAKIFGPQKGATPSIVGQLESALAKFSRVVFRLTGDDIAGRKRGGAAGGVSAGLRGLLNAKLADGTDYFLDITGFESSLEKADIVITGEGSIDAQTLRGKGPFGVALRALKRNIPVIGLAGRVPLRRDSRLRKYFDVLLAIGNEPAATETAIRHTADNLRRTAREIGNTLALRFGTRR